MLVNLVIKRIERPTIKSQAKFENNLENFLKKKQTSQISDF